MLPLIDEWVDNYQQSANDDVSERASVHELVLLCIRCCGLSDDIEEGEVLDADGAGDVLERIQDEIVKVWSVHESGVQLMTIDEPGSISPHLKGEDLSIVSDKPQCFHSSSNNDPFPLTLLVRYIGLNPTHHADRPPYTQLAPFDVLLATPSHSSHFNLSYTQAQHCFVRCRCRIEHGLEYEAASKGNGGEKVCDRSSRAKEVEGGGRQGQGGARQENAIIGIYAGDIRRVSIRTYEAI